MKLPDGFNWIVILGILVTIEQQIGGGTMSIVHLFPESWVPGIKEGAGDLASIGTAIMSVGAFGRVPGANLPIPPLLKSAILLALCAGLLLFGFAGSAQAQGLKPLKPLKDLLPKAAGTMAPPAAKPAAPATDWLTKAMADIETVKTDAISGAIGALNEADADASTLTNPSDTSSFHDAISHACYPAQIKFLQSLPAAAAIQAPPPFNLIVLFQRKRDFVMLIQAGLPSYLKVGCAALLGDEATILVKSLGLVGVTLAADAILPGSGGLALPALPALAL